MTELNIRTRIATCKAAKQIIDSDGRPPEIIVNIESVLIEPLYTDNRINKLIINYTDTFATQLNIYLQVVNDVGNVIENYSFNHRGNLTNIDLVHVKNWFICLLDNFNNITILDLAGFDLDFMINNITNLTIDDYHSSRLEMVFDSVRHLHINHEKLNITNNTQTNRIIRQFPNLEKLSTNINLDDISTTNKDNILLNRLTEILYIFFENKYEFTLEILAFFYNLRTGVMFIHLNGLFNTLAENIGCEYNLETHTFYYLQSLSKRHE